MTDIKQMHSHLSDLIWNAQCHDEKQAADNLLIDAERLGKQILELNPKDAEATYAVALTWYHRSGSPNRRECVSWLLRTEEIDPHFPWVPLYLGYTSFDEADYKAAHRHFTRVDRSFFSSIDQHWRNLKTDELLLVCQMRGDFDRPAFSSLTALVHNYVSSVAEDRAIPLEIVDAVMVPECRERFEVYPAQIALETIRMLTGIGDDVIFADQIAELQRVADNTG